MPKGVLSPDQLPRFLETKKIEFPTISEEEIKDRNKGDGFSKNDCPRSKHYGSSRNCLARKADHLDLALVESC